jgi:hypothetical protein
MTEEALGLLLQQIGEPEAGAELLAHVYPVYLKQPGPEHPYTRQLAKQLGKESS